jgi:folate-dependent tRNA-U54 methylase TrmFO/GidA
MNANFGILPDLGVRVKDKTAKKLMYSERSLKDLKNLII